MNKDYEEKLIQKAIVCLENKLIYRASETLSSSTDVSNYLRLQLANEESEIFACLFLNEQHQLIKFEKLFYGTINEATIHPREIVRKAILYNSSKLIISHNHPSGNCYPSRADIQLTKSLKNILNIIDVNLLDHIIVSSNNTCSLAEQELI